MDSDNDHHEHKVHDRQPASARESGYLDSWDGECPRDDRSDPEEATVWTRDRSHWAHPPPHSCVEIPQNRQHPSMIGLGHRQVEFGEDVGDVLLDRSLGYEEGLSDRRIGSTLCHE